MLLRLVTPPTGEPVTLQEAKDHLRLDESHDDAHVNRLITVARMYTEQVCWRSFLTTTYEATFPGFLGNDRFELPARRNFSNSMVGYEWTNTDRAYRFFPYLELPMGNLDLSTPVVSFTYTDQNNAPQTVDPSIYEVDSVSVPGRIRLAYNQAWPLTLDHWNAVVLQYKVGWTSAANVPAPIKQAILILLAELYEHRTIEIESRTSPVAFSYNALLAPYRLIRF